MFKIGILKKALIFVYNAKSDILNKYLDAVHKIVSPTTYSCDLCNLTHGSFSEKQIWKDFREKTSSELVFMYKDEFLGAYSDLNIENLTFPLVFKKENSVIEILFDSKVVTSLSSVKDLIDLVKQYDEV